MAFGILTLITALTISAVAIYYSVAGLAAIFAAAVVPIIVMGVSLEVGKLVTAVWLHRHWQQAKWWLKTYLSIAVVVLMFITSMGIFGYLSKAHIEQTSLGEESVAQVERIETELLRYQDVIERAEAKINTLQTSGTSGDANIQAQIDKEQERIDKAFDRIQPAIQEQNKIIAGVTQLFQDELDKIDQELETLQSYVDNGEIKKAQQMIGASADGIFGKNTAEKIGDWKEEKQAERAEWLQKIQDAADSPTVKAARDEIKRLRQSAEDQVKQSNELIERLRGQLGNKDKVADIDAQVDEQTTRIKNANAEIDKLTEKKFDLQAEYRKLEAEVGPIKYIAEFVYGENADKDLLEEAVRWVIIVIIFVFDPLAVLLLIASQYSFIYANGGRKPLPPTSSTDPEDDPEPPYTDEEWDEAHRDNYEYDRARKIEANEPPDFTKEDADENSRRETGKEESQDVEALRDGQDEERLQRQTENDSVVAESEAGEVNDTTDTTTTDDDSGDVVSEDDITDTDVPDTTMEQPQVQADETSKQEELNPPMPLEQWNAMIEEAEKAAEEEKSKDIDDTIKNMKEEGEWPPLQEERLKPDLTEVIEPQKKRETYLQKSRQGKQILKVKKQ